MNYWQVKVKIEFENDKGKIQKINELYLISAISATDAEAKMYKYLEENGSFQDLNVVEVKQTKFLKVI